MKKLFVCQIVDIVTEAIVSTTLSPSLKFAERQFKEFCSNVKNPDVGDFELRLVDNVTVPETFSESMNCDIVSIYGHDMEFITDETKS